MNDLIPGQLYKLDGTVYECHSLDPSKPKNFDYFVIVNSIMEPYPGPVMFIRYGYRTINNNPHEVVECLVGEKVIHLISLKPSFGYQLPTLIPWED